MRREINGFLVEATAEPNFEGSCFYEPGLRVTRPGTDFDETVWATTQNAETQTREQALAAAEAWLNQITHVSHAGSLTLV